MWNTLRQDPALVLGFLQPTPSGEVAVHPDPVDPTAAADSDTYQENSFNKVDLLSKSTFYFLLTHLFRYIMSKT